MTILRTFFTEDLAVDLGTVNTLIYAPDQGIVLNEPSAVAINKFSHEVLAVGAEAYKLLGREPKDTEVRRPIRGGTIDDFDVTRSMLGAFIGRVQGKHRRRLHLVVGVPGSATSLEQHSLKDAAHDVKAARVDLVDEGLAAGLGAGVAFNNEQAHMIVDVGGGTTNVAVIASGAIVSSISLHAGGQTMDEAIRDFIKNEYAVHIGELTAEQIKKDLGSASFREVRSGEEGRMEIVGKDLKNGMGRDIDVKESDVCEALEPVITEIISGVRRVVEESAPEVTADIYRTGVILTGGGSLLRGFAGRLQAELKLHVAAADNPLEAVVAGAGRLLDYPERLQRVSIQHDLPAWQMSDNLVVNW